jgi:hypothetical protein
MFGVTCAHCIGGLERNRLRPMTSRKSSPVEATFLALDVSRDALAFLVIGIFPNFGDCDAGLAEVSIPAIKTFVRTRALSVFRPPSKPLLGQTSCVCCSSLQLKDGEPQQTNVIRGRIDGVFVDTPPNRFDLMIDDSTEMVLQDREI